MNPFIENCSRENNFKLLSRQLKVESFDVFVRGSPIFTLNKFKFIVKLDCGCQYPNNTIDASKVNLLCKLQSFLNQIT